MNHDDDLERLIRGSLTSRSNAIGTTVGSVDDVHRRVDLRRGRRRHVAAFGATAMLAAGAFALTAVGSSDPSTVPLASADGDDSTLDQVVWRCTGQLDVLDDSGAAYYASCETTGIDQGIPILSIPVTTMEVYPDVTMVCVTPTAPPTSDPITTGVPCDWVPPATTAPADCSIGVDTVVTSPCSTDCSTMSRPADVTLPEGFCDVVPTTEFDPDSADPVYSSDGPNCTPGTGVGIECALINIEQQHTIAPGDSLVSIARRYRLSVDTLVTYNQWPDGLDHLLIPGDTVRIPPYPTNGTMTSAPTTATTTTTQP